MKSNGRTRSAYMMIDALVYIGACFVLLGVGFTAMYRCIDNSIALRRSADDLTGALHVGERWRADVRKASGALRTEAQPGEQVLHVPYQKAEIVYRSADAALFRRIGAGPWTCILTNVAASEMRLDQRQGLSAWRWELELKTRTKTSRIRPLFTFMAVPMASPKP